MRRRCDFIKGIDGHGAEHAELYGDGLLERGAAFRLIHVMREWRPWQGDAGTLGLGRARLRFGAAHRGDLAFAACDAFCRLMQLADRTLAADWTVIEVRRRDAQAPGQQLLRIEIGRASCRERVEV